MKILSAILISVAMTGAAVAATKDVAKPDTAMATTAVDKATFVKTVGNAGTFEIESSKLALQKASSADVKKFAEEMIKDHTKAGKRLTAILKKKGETAPPDTLAPKDADAMTKLNAASGAEFDKTYISLQESAHTDAVALFKNYIANPDDKRLGKFAKNTLPTIEMHLEHAKKLATATQ